MPQPSAPAVAVPYLEPLVAAAWWTVGAAALDGGLGTVLLAGGLGVSGGLLVALHRRHGSGGRLPAGVRGRFLRTLGITAALLAVSGTVLGFFSLGELVVPLGAAVVGIAAISLASVLDARGLVAVGGVLLVLGATGALLALDSAGRLYPVGVVGLTAGAVFWLAAAHRGGLFGGWRSRTEPRPAQPPAHGPDFGPLPGPARRGDTRKLPLPGERDPARRGR